MSANDDKQNVNTSVSTDSTGKKDVNINLALNTAPQVKELREEMERIKEQARKDMEAERTKYQAAEQARLDAIAKLEAEKQSIATEKEKLVQEKDDYKSKLDIIADREYKAKKNAIIERAKKDNIPEAKLKDIEARLSDPQNGPANLAGAEFFLTTFEEAFEGQKAQLAKAEEDRKKAEDARKAAELANATKRAPEGGDTLNYNQNVNNNTNVNTNVNVKKEGVYSSTEEMIRDLYQKARSTNTNAQERTQAETTIKALLTKTANQFKEEFKHKKPLAEQFVEKDSDNVSGYSPYNKREEVKTFKQMKETGA